MSALENARGKTVRLQGSIADGPLSSVRFLGGLRLNGVEERTRFRGKGGGFVVGGLIRARCAD